jgi:4-azaleucine resistance transporter AzlC
MIAALESTSGSVSILRPAASRNLPRGVRLRDDTRGVATTSMDGDFTVALADSRRRLLIDGAGIALSGIPFGVVYGLAARTAGFSPLEATAMSVFVNSGAAQFAAIGYLAQGLSWPVIFLLTALIGARHLLYSAVFAPWFADLPRVRRAVLAFFLDDESFALSLGHFTRIGRRDVAGYVMASVGLMYIPWVASTTFGAVVGTQIPDPRQFGLDVIFPAAMAGLAAGLVTERREAVAAVLAAVIAVTAGLVLGVGVGVIAGGIVGPAVAVALMRRPDQADAVRFQSGAT